MLEIEPLSIFDRWEPSAPGDNGEWWEPMHSLEKLATKLKKSSPDEAISALKQAEDIGRAHNLHPTGLLMLRLRMATILYEAERFYEAEAMLYAEFVVAKTIRLTNETKRRADSRYRQRIDCLVNPKPHELRRDGVESPDFERNLYCLYIYEKMRICYNRQGDNLQAAVWACAEAYARYENETHNCDIDNPEPKLDKVEKLLAKAKRPELQGIAISCMEKYASEPVCEKCWQMTEELSRILRI